MQRNADDAIAALEPYIGIQQPNTANRHLAEAYAYLGSAYELLEHCDYITIRDVYERGRTIAQKMGNVDMQHECSLDLLTLARRHGKIKDVGVFAEAVRELTQQLDSCDEEIEDKENRLAFDEPFAIDIVSKALVPSTAIESSTIPVTPHTGRTTVFLPETWTFQITLKSGSLEATSTTAPFTINIPFDLPSHEYSATIAVLCDRINHVVLAAHGIHIRISDIVFDSEGQSLSLETTLRTLVGVHRRLTFQLEEVVVPPLIQHFDAMAEVHPQLERLRSRVVGRGNRSVDLSRCIALDKEAVLMALKVLSYHLDEIDVLNLSLCLLGMRLCIA